MTARQQSLTDDCNTTSKAGVTYSGVLEFCVASVEDLHLANGLGADRIELCTALELGGLTPSFGLMKQASNLPMPTVVLIRPRLGGFHYNSADLGVMHFDIGQVRNAGLSGVAFGALGKDGSLDSAALRPLVEAARGMRCVLHRAFDLVPDPFAALEAAIELGFHRILTSGQATRAIEGADLIARLVAQADGRIEILPAAGIQAAHAQALLKTTQAGQLHASCSKRLVSTSVAETAYGFAPSEGRLTLDEVKARALRAAVAPYKNNKIEVTQNMVGAV